MSALLSMKEAAELSGKSISTISRRIKKGEIPAQQNPIRINRTDLAKVYSISNETAPPVKQCGSISVKADLLLRIDNLNSRVTSLENMVLSLTNGKKKKKGKKKKGKK